MSGRPPIQAKSIRDLARKVGRSESAVRKWLRRGNWPFSLTPPWVVRDVKAWMRIHLSPDPAKAYRDRAAAAEAGTGEFHRLSTDQRASVAYKMERTLWVRQRREHEAGKFHDTEKCRQRRLRQIHAVKSALLALPRSVARRLVGCKAREIERVLTEAVTGICEEFASDASS